MNSAFVTGGTGLIGLALLDCLEEAGVRTTVMVRPGSSRLGLIKRHDRLTVVEGDLDGDLSQFDWPAESHDAWFHLGWNTASREIVADPAIQVQSIVRTLDAVEFAAKLGCQVFVGAGSQAEYGRVQGTLSGQTPTNPDSAYGIAKLAAGLLSKAMCERVGIRHCWCRILSVYGPNDKPTTGLMYVINSLLDGKKPGLTPCEQVWDYLYVRDCARALLLAAESGTHGAVYPIGSGQARPLRQYFECIRDLIDPSLPLGLGDKGYAPNQVMHLCADISALSKDTGFKPAYSFADGIKETIDWCRSQRVGLGMA
jgi:UDP-glucose 4-epimerase